MKKIISLVFVFAMLFACTVPAMADDFYRDQTISEPTTCRQLVIADNVSLRIDSSVDVETSDLSFINLGMNSTLIIGSNGLLTGEGILFSAFGGAQIIVEDGGAVNISFLDSFGADEFAALLDESGINYRYVNNRIIAPCPHASASPVSAFVCNDCGEIVSVDTYTASLLSQGYPEIVYGIGGIAIGVVTTLLISRKKKVAVSSTSADDAE